MLLETENLTIGYGNKAVQTHLCLNASERDLICLTGTNGAGKSTLLRTLAGLQPPLNGKIILNGQDIGTINQRDRARTMALVLTDDVDVENLSVRELVSMGRFPYTNWAGSLTKYDNDIVDNAISNVNITHKSFSKINEISDGEKQRAIIAKALAQDTPLVLLDEPTAHLDLPNRIEIMLLLRRLSVSTGKTFIMSTHELDLALQMSDRIWLMTPNGIETGLPEDLMLSGRFQSAFGSSSFYFDPINGHCRINHIQGTLTIKVNTLPDAQQQEAWLKHALMRIGINISDNSHIEITCHPKGYYFGKDTINYTTIQAILKRMEHL